MFQKRFTESDFIRLSATAVQLQFNLKIHAKQKQEHLYLQSYSVRQQ